SGQPIVMLADRQTTGGYPKIATIITPDIRLLVHRRTGETVRFSSVSIEEAEDLARAATRELKALPQTVRYKRTGDDELLAVNLAGHATSANDPTTWQP
ncbi:MAG: allophanate hydrolase subunit 2 family protein, partial [Hyphomicrobiaceae bacterium]